MELISRVSSGHSIKWKNCMFVMVLEVRSGTREHFTKQITVHPESYKIVVKLNNSVQENSDFTEQLVDSNEQLISKMNDRDDRQKSCSTDNFSLPRKIPSENFSLNTYCNTKLLSQVREI